MLNLKKLGFGLCLLSFISLGCESSNTKVGTGPRAPIMEDNSKTALTWVGSYIGVIPCADCSGIATEVTLYKDQSYSWGYKYLGKSDDIVEFKGFFEWEAQGKIVVFKDANSGDVLNRFKLEENSLRMLDKEGKIIEGDLSHNYILYKPGTGIKGRYWALTEINSKSIASTTTLKEAFLIFSDTSNKVSGNGSCNAFFGSYQLSESNQIRIKGVGSTMMACSNQEIEIKYLKILQQINSYAISGDTLTLKKEEEGLKLKFVFKEFN
jgi:copper homeostasis protein (lipoprotein)